MKLTITAVAYLFTVFATYLLVTCIIAAMGGWTFKYIAFHNAQVLGWITFYWWCPAWFVAYDLSEKYGLNK